MAKFISASLIFAAAFCHLLTMLFPLTPSLVSIEYRICIANLLLFSIAISLVAKEPRTKGTNQTSE